MTPWATTQANNSKAKLWTMTLSSKRMEIIPGKSFAKSFICSFYFPHSPSFSEISVTTICDPEK